MSNFSAVSICSTFHYLFPIRLYHLSLPVLFSIISHSQISLKFKCVMSHKPPTHSLINPRYLECNKLLFSKNIVRSPALSLLLSLNLYLELKVDSLAEDGRQTDGPIPGEQENRFQAAAHHSQQEEEVRRRRSQPAGKIDVTLSILQCCESVSFDTYICGSGSGPNFHTDPDPNPGKNDTDPDPWEKNSMPEKSLKISKTGHFTCHMC